MQNKILIFGAGVVGQATKKMLEDYNVDNEVYFYDPNVEPYKKLPEFKIDAAFVCVPAPTVKLDSGDFFVDNTIVQECIEITGDSYGLCPTFIRSTLPPGSIESFKYKYHEKIYHMPEYLRDAKGYDSVVDLPLITSCDNRKLLAYIFGSKNEKRILTYPSYVCEMTKYVQNCFFALKITYFNMIKVLCEGIEINYDQLMDATFATASVTGTISRECTQVPGPDGKMGYDGKCLPKDSQAFANKKFVDGEYTIHNLMSFVDEANKRFRDLKL